MRSSLPRSENPALLLPCPVLAVPHTRRSVVPREGAVRAPQASISHLAPQRSPQQAGFVCPGFGQSCMVAKQEIPQPEAT